MSQGTLTTGDLKNAQMQGRGVGEKITQSKKINVSGHTTCRSAQLVGCLSAVYMYKSVGSNLTGLFNCYMYDNAYSVSQRRPVTLTLLHCLSSYHRFLGLVSFLIQINSKGRFKN